MGKKINWAKGFRLGLLGLSLLAWASFGNAAILKAWADMTPGKNAGTFTDKDGSTIQYSTVEGPKAGEKALRFEAHIRQWAGFWTKLECSVSPKGALRFAAKVSQPEIIQVGLMDEKKVQYVASVRVLSNGWKEFTVPLSLFVKTAYPMPEAPKDKPLDWSKIQGFQIQPQSHGDFTVEMGPLSYVKEKAKAVTGGEEEAGGLLVQDFAFLEKTAYGPYQDAKTGSAIQLALKKDAGAPGGIVADFQYNLKDEGWCGYWMRVGDVWGGQDWRGAKSLILEVKSQEPLQLQIGFNDANQNAYVAMTQATRGGEWEKVTIPFNAFTLNPFYQPPEAKKGAAQDLSHMETLNIAPVIRGKHEFRIRKIMLTK